MTKAENLLSALNTVLEDTKKDDKDLVPINEPETDDFTDLNVDGDEKKDKEVEEEKPDEFTQSVLDIMKHGNDNPEDYDQDQLNAGIEVEKEHTGNFFIQRAIAMAHLSEFKDYYSYLSKMEDALREKEDKTKDSEDKEKEEKDI